MKDCEIVLLILNCYKYKEKAEMQKRTWLKTIDSNIEYFHVIGDKEKCGNNDFVFDYERRELLVNTMDDYNSLPSKVIYALDAVNSTYNYKYIFKTDDDQRLVHPEFLTELPKYLKNSQTHHYGGFIVNVEDHISKYYTVHDCLPHDLLLKKCIYCNGRFYLLSKPAIDNLLTNKAKICEHIIEDHSIGLYLDDKYKENMLYFDTRVIFNDS